MGQCSSGSNVYSSVPYTKNWKSQFDALRLTEADVGKLYKIFRKIATDASGNMKLLDLLNFLDVDNNNFTRRVFSIFDEDESGCIDFREFVVSLWNYCTLGNATLALFAFDLYDRDSSGHIDSREVDILLRDIYGPKITQSKLAKKILLKVESMGHVVFDKDVFRTFLAKHPYMMFEAFDMQRRIKQKCLGERFWERYTERRIEMGNGEFMSVGEIIRMLNTESSNKLTRTGSRRTGKAARGKSMSRICRSDTESINGDENKSEVSVIASTMGSHSKRRLTYSSSLPATPSSSTSEKYVRANSIQHNNFHSKSNQQQDNIPRNNNSSISTVNSSSGKSRSFSRRLTYPPPNTSQNAPNRFYQSRRSFDRASSSFANDLSTLDVIDEVNENSLSPLSKNQPQVGIKDHLDAARKLMEQTDVRKNPKLRGVKIAPKLGQPGPGKRRRQRTPSFGPSD